MNYKNRFEYKLIDYFVKKINELKDTTSSEAGRFEVGHLNEMLEFTKEESPEAWEQYQDDHK